MPATHVTSLFRALATTPSRRGVARALAGSTFAVFLAPLFGLTETDAKRHKKKKRRRKKQRKKGCGERQIRVGGQCVCPTQCCRDADCTEGPTGTCQSDGSCQYPCAATSQPCGGLTSCCDSNADCENGVCTICIDEGSECDRNGIPCCSGGVCEQVSEETWECFV